MTWDTPTCPAAAVTGFQRKRFRPDPASVCDQCVCAFAVCTEKEWTKRLRFGSLKQRGGRRVAENRAERTVAGVDVFRVRFRGDEKHAAGNARADETVRKTQTVNVTGAAEVEVQSTAVDAQAKTMLNKTGRRWDRIIRRLCTQKDEIDAFPRDLMFFEEFFSSFDRHIGRKFIRS